VIRNQSQMVQWRIYFY